MDISINKVITIGLLAGSALTGQAYASVINTLDGTGYEWLELSNTTNLSRVTVESLLGDTTSALYGYRYATRLETQALLESYMPYVPAELNHWEAYAAPGAQSFFNDFGITWQDDLGVINQALSNDGVIFDYNMHLISYFNYGAAGECGVDVSCAGNMFTAALDGSVQAMFTPSHRGFDATWATPDTFSNFDANQIQASLLVRELIAVPVPAAVWLFSTGLIGLMAVVRSRKLDSTTPARTSSRS
ncbi:MAG: hypothetical protein HYZ31_11160 [Gammaproteobacteria bacterium]|nr:hypothetical protein [Gammaproteobacteria bacterium]